MGIRKYYDIEYSAQANVNAQQRVYLSEIEHDDFSVEAMLDARQHVTDNPEVEGDLNGDWKIDYHNTEADEIKEGDTGWHCCICGDGYEDGYGNNPDPVLYNAVGNEIDYHEDPRCCDACNTNHVIPARLKELLP